MQNKWVEKSMVIGAICLVIGASALSCIGKTIADTTLTATGRNNTMTINRGAWSDNFDSYATGSSLHGQGGWLAWDNNPATTVYVTDAQSRSTPNSVDIAWFGGVAGDIVHDFTDINTGIWIFIAWQYVPSTMIGNSFFILMNKYTPGTTHNIQDWSLQLQVSASGGFIRDYDNQAASLPLVTDEWAEIRVEINFNSDTQTIYYNGDELTSKSWSGGVSPGGQVNLACVDLYADSALSTSVYYDDMSVDVPEPLTCDANGPYAGTVGEPIQFTGTASGGTPPYTFEWDFGNGDTSTQQNPMYTYDSAGEFDVILTVTDNIGSIATDETTATIEGVPELMIAFIQGGLFKVSAEIANTGSKEATDVSWSITLQGGAFIGKESTGAGETIAADDKITITSKFILGFGPTVITVTAESPDTSDTKEQEGFVLLFFIKV